MKVPGVGQATGCILLLQLLCGAGLLADPPAPVALEDLRMSRMRIEQQLFLKGSILNPNDKHIQNARIRVTYLDETGKTILQSAPLALGLVRAGQSVPFELHTKRTPAYTHYVLTVHGRYEGKAFQQEFRGQGMQPPRQVPRGPVTNRAMVTFESIWDERKDRDVRIQGSLHNYGDTPAHDIIVHLKFMGERGPVKAYRYRSRESIPGGGELDFSFTIKQCPEYREYTKRLDYRFGDDARDGLDKPQSSTARETSEDRAVQVRNCTIRKQANAKGLIFAGIIDNHRDRGIRNTRVTVKLMDAHGAVVRRVSHAIRLKIPPSFVQPFSFTIQGAPPYASYTVGLEYQIAP